MSMPKGRRLAREAQSSDLIFSDVGHESSVLHHSRRECSDRSHKATSRAAATVKRWVHSPTKSSRLALVPHGERSSSWAFKVSSLRSPCAPPACLRVGDLPRSGWETAVAGSEGSGGGAVGRVGPLRTVKIAFRVRGARGMASSEDNRSLQQRPLQMCNDLNFCIAEEPRSAAPNACSSDKIWGSVK